MKTPPQKCPNFVVKFMRTGALFILTNVKGNHGGKYSLQPNQEVSTPP